MVRTPRLGEGGNRLWLACALLSVGAISGLTACSSETGASTSTAAVSELLEFAVAGDIDSARPLVLRVSEESLRQNIEEIREFVDGAGGLTNLRVTLKEQFGAEFDISVEARDGSASAEFTVVEDAGEFFVVPDGAEAVTSDDIGPTSAPGPLPVPPAETISP